MRLSIHLQDCEGISYIMYSGYERQLKEGQAQFHEYGKNSSCKKIARLEAMAYGHGATR